ncbi:MAG: 4-hydroxy-3-methylbut-2-enyl diphosphate reductase [Candidatus Korarchaeota archaeon]
MNEEKKVVELAEYAGFCSGVRRALSIVLNSRKLYTGPIYTLGPLIHNTYVIEKLKQMEIYPSEDLNEVKNVLVLRSHGTPQPLEEEARKKGLIVVDATCPFVKKAHKGAKELEDEERKVIILGDPNHAEVQGTASYVKSPLIISSVEEAMQVPEIERAGVVAQTTFSIQKFAKIISILSEKVKDLRVINTICNATYQRQNAAIELAKRSDVMIVLGSRFSSNTNKLAEICQSIVKTFHIDLPEELDINAIKDAKRIGITAGASTPDDLIEEIIDRLKSAFAPEIIRPNNSRGESNAD